MLEIVIPFRVLIPETEMWLQSEGARLCSAEHCGAKLDCIMKGYDRGQERLMVSIKGRPSPIPLTV